MLPAHFARDKRPLVYAHRGASADAPENTLAAFRLALEQDADGVELDAQRCASGEVVVVHDDSLLRTTGLAALVTRTSWSTLRGLDAGAWKGERFRGERVPLLAEVLAAFPRLVNVELKCETANDGGLTAEVVRVVRDAGAADRVLLSSFNPLCLWRARLRAPRIPRALLFERDQRWVLRSGLSAPAVGALALHPEHVLATPERVERWRKRGYSVACWTVDDPEGAARLYRSGVGALITNRPSLLRARFPG
jgi:glycerophosphoryl diester phosphodiesterase